MKNKALWLLAGITALTIPAFAQSGAGDTLSALLVEVRQLRLAMEQAATTTPQIQLLGTRLGIQNERLSRAGRDHDAARQELEEVSASLAELTSQIPELEARIAQDANPQHQQMFAAEQSAAKQKLAELTARQQRLQSRESELAGVLGAEQNQWTELNRRLDELERSIAARQPR